MGSKVGRTRKWLLAGFAAGLVALALGGCSTYYGYHPGWATSWDNSPGGYNNADRARDGGSNALFLADFEGNPISKIGTGAPSNRNLGNQADSIGSTPVFVRLNPAESPTTVDQAWTDFVYDELVAMHNEGLTIIGVQIGNETNRNSDPDLQFWGSGSYARFFSDTAEFIRNDPDLNEGGPGDLNLGLGDDIITAGLAPLHPGPAPAHLEQYDLQAECPPGYQDNPNDSYTCPRVYIKNVLNTISANNWAQPDGVAIHLYSTGEHGSVTPSYALDRMVGSWTDSQGVEHLGQYERFISATGNYPVWVTEAGSYTDAIDPMWNANKYQDQESIDVGVVAGLQNEPNEPKGVFGFTLNDLIPSGQVKTGARQWGVLDPSNNPKPGLTSDPSSPSAYCVLAALANKPPPAGC